MNLFNRIYIVADKYSIGYDAARSLSLNKSEFVFCNIDDIQQKLRGLNTEVLVIVCPPLNPVENRDLKRFVMWSEAYVVPFNSVYPELIDMYKQNKEKDLNYLERVKQKFTTSVENLYKIDTGALPIMKEKNLFYSLQVSLRGKLICCLCRIPVTYDIERIDYGNEIIVRMRCHGREENFYLGRRDIMQSKLDLIAFILSATKPFIMTILF